MRTGFSILSRKGISFGTAILHGSLIFYTNKLTSLWTCFFRVSNSFGHVVLKQPPTNPSAFLERIEKPVCKNGPPLTQPVKHCTNSDLNPTTLKSDIMHFRLPREGSIQHTFVNLCQQNLGWELCML